MQMSGLGCWEREEEPQHCVGKRGEARGEEERGEGMGNCGVRCSNTIDRQVGDGEIDRYRVTRVNI